MAGTVTPTSLALWARQFSTLINAGVSLVRCLLLLETIDDKRVSEATRDLRARVEGGETLSLAMSAHPEVFNRLSLSLCRAGEVGGVLDETFAVWADWLERDLELRARLDMYYLLNQVGKWPVPREDYEARLRMAIPDLDDRVREMTWCRLMGMMLDSGVPIIQSLEVATREVYPENADPWVRGLHEAVRAGRSLAAALEELGFSALTLQLVAVGEECRTIERMLDMAARLLERGLNLRLSAALTAMVGPPEPIEEQ